MDTEMENILRNDKELNDIRLLIFEKQNKIAKINTDRAKVTGELNVLKNKISKRKIELIREHGREK